MSYATTPLRARDGGVLVLAGHTEAAVDISRLAGRPAAGVICEIMNEDGTMARLPELKLIAARHGLKIGTISDLISYRQRHDHLVAQTDCRAVTSAYGSDWMMHLFTDAANGMEHIALVKGEPAKAQQALVRMHAFDPIADTLALNPDRVDLLPRAMLRIADEGCGVVVFLRDPQQKVQLGPQVQPRILRKYGVGAQILSALGLSNIRLLSDSLAPKRTDLDAFGLKITETLPLS